jgi:hypothetical protein
MLIAIDAAESSTGDLSLLAAFVLLRGLQVVPSLIRTEWEAIKNKQYSMAISTVISKFFSPTLIQAELSLVRDEQGKGNLTDDNLTIKVLSNVSEVKAIVSYAIKANNAIGAKNDRSTLLTSSLWSFRSACRPSSLWKGWKSRRASELACPNRLGERGCLMSSSLYPLK